jgi:hypothetical protein
MRTPGPSQQAFRAASGPLGLGLAIAVAAVLILGVSVVHCEDPHGSARGAHDESGHHYHVVQHGVDLAPRPASLPAGPGLALLLPEVTAIDVPGPGTSQPTTADRPVGASPPRFLACTVLLL